MRLTKSKNERRFWPALQKHSSMNWMALILLGGLAVIFVLVLPMSVNAEECQGSIVGQDFKQPDEIRAKNGALNTKLVVKFKDHPCVPVLQKNKGKWVQMNLRTYGYPDPSAKISPGMPSVSSRAVYCRTSEFVGSVRISIRSCFVRLASSTRIGNRP